MTECINWPGTIEQRGYGVITFRENGKLKKLKAHRFVWALFNTPIPDGMYVLHSCDNKKCVNPAHLHLGTHVDNMRELKERGLKKGKHLGTESPNHKLTEAEVQTIKSCLMAGQTQVALAIRFGVTQACIASIQRGRTWAHVI